MPSNAPQQSIRDRLYSSIDESIQSLLAPIHSLLSSLNPIPYFEALASSISSFINSPTIHRSLLGSIIFAWLFCASVLISIVAYVAFYWTYVPQIGLTIPLWLQYGEARMPYAVIDLSTYADQIAIDQPYNVAVRLTVPANERNFDLGNFMTRLTLTTPPPLNKTLHRASRHASLIYQPFFARNLDSIKYLRTLFYFSAPQMVQHLDINLLTEKIIHAHKKDRLGLAQVEIGRNDSGELHVYDATLVFNASLDGLRALMYYHPYLSFGFFCILFLTAEFTSVLFTWALIILRRSQARPLSPKKEPPSVLLSPPTFDSSQVLDDSGTGFVTRHGMSEIDDLLGPDEEHLAVDEDQRKPVIPLSVKLEEVDDDELVGGSETTGASSGARSLGSSLGRTASSTSS